MPSLDVGTGPCTCGVLMVQVGGQSSSHRTQHQEERGGTGWWLGPAVLLVCTRACNSTVSLPSIPQLGQGHSSFLVAPLKNTGRAQRHTPSSPCSGSSPAQQSSEFKASDTAFPALKNSKMHLKISHTAIALRRDLCFKPNVTHTWHPSNLDMAYIKSNMKVRHQ